ncbi:hypothetical protein PSCICF_32090 [Pseudomonas cichorii]|nr:hypothetical protein PSCICF_32090 [Pseudomonas cichorii]GFM59993.1 hypothetical protein PSCICG_11530 [Pseudomonas cichorii]
MGRDQGSFDRFLAVPDMQVGNLQFVAHGVIVLWWSGLLSRRKALGWQVAQTKTGKFSLPRPVVAERGITDSVC